MSYEINASGENITNTRIGISDIRIHPSYITYYTMWTRLLATGIFPLGTIHILRKHFEGVRKRQKIAVIFKIEILKKVNSKKLSFYIDFFFQKKIFEKNF